MDFLMKNGYVIIAEIMEMMKVRMKMMIKAMMKTMMMKIMKKKIMMIVMKKKKMMTENLKLRFNKTLNIDIIFIIFKIFFLFILIKIDKY